MSEPKFDHNKKPLQKPPQTEPEEPKKEAPKNPLADLQQKVGNQAVQRMLAQRSGGDSGFELDDETSSRIDSARGSGQQLDSGVNEQMSNAMGADFSDVRVHNDSESHELNQQVGAEAFTTGKDIFFRDGAYEPQSSSGQELIAHELTHVVQQGQGLTGGGAGGNMTVNEPGDVHEQQADAVAQSVTSSDVQAHEAPESDLQLQEDPEDELQLQEDPEDELQLQELEEEEELEVQRQPEDELEEEEARP